MDKAFADEPQAQVIGGTGATASPSEESAVLLYQLDQVKQSCLVRLSVSELAAFLPSATPSSSVEGFGDLDLRLISLVWASLSEEAQRSICYKIFRVPEELWPQRVRTPPSPQRARAPLAKNLT